AEDGIRDPLVTGVQTCALPICSLVERGLDAEAVELGIMDGLPGLQALFKRFFPRSQTQRCQKHAKANACRRVRKKERELFSKDQIGRASCRERGVIRVAIDMSK